MRLITACVLAIPALLWWPVDVVRHRGVGQER